MLLMSYHHYSTQGTKLISSSTDIAVTWLFHRNSWH